MTILLYSSILKKKFSKHKSITLFDFNRKNLNSDNFYNNDFLFNNVRNKKNFDKEFVKLKKIIFRNLIKKLNSYHKSIKFNELSWKVLLEPWLSNYISKNIYYWHLINYYKKRVKKYPFFLEIEYLDPPIDTAHATQLSDKSEEYNFYLLQNMCKFIFGKKKRLLNKNSFIKKDFKIDLDNFYPNTNNFFPRLYNLLFFKFFQNNKIVFDINNIGIKKLLINFKFFQIPIFSNIFFKKPNYDKLYSDFRKIKSKRENSNKIYKKKSLEEYLLVSSLKDLPSCFLENFEKIFQRVKNIKLHPKVITSDGRHEFNLYFKFWIALKISEGNKFVSCDHGSCYISNLDDMTHEDCSHYSLRWFKYKSKNSVQLPVLHNLRKRNSNEKLRENLIIISTDLEKFPRHVLWSPIHNENLYQIKIVHDISNGIKKIIQNKTFVKLHPRVSNSKSTLNTQIPKYFFNKKKNIQILKSQKEFEKVFYNSKLNVSLSPHTAFIESFLSGPTVLVINKNFYKIREEFQNLHEELFKANILFYDGKKAIKHINMIWDNPEVWWNKNKVFKLRKKFENLVCKTKNTEETINEWSIFFKRLI